MFIPTANWELTKKCGPSKKGCIHCYLSNKDSEIELDQNQAREMIDKLINYGLRHLSLTGGEPKLHPYLKEIIRYLLEKGITINVNSNGFLVNKQDVQFFNKNKIEVAYSLHAISHSCFEAIYRCKHKYLDNLINAISTTEKCSVNTVLMQPNIKDINNIKKFIEKIKKPWNIFKLIRVGYGKKPELQVSEKEKELVNHLYSWLAVKDNLPIDIELEQRNCSLSKNTINFFINPDSSLRACYGLVNFNSQKKLVTHNLEEILKEPIFSMWNNCKECSSKCHSKCKAELLDSSKFEEFCSMINPVMLSKNIIVNQKLSIHFSEEEQVYEVYNLDAKESYKVPLFFKEILFTNNLNTSKLLENSRKKYGYRFTEVLNFLFSLENMNIVKLDGG